VQILTLLTFSTQLVLLTAQQVGPRASLLLKMSLRNKSGRPYPLKYRRKKKRVADVLTHCAGLTAPHPNAGCVLVDDQGRVIAETHQRAQVGVGAYAACQKGIPLQECAIAATSED
jgi:hypothetical protein